MYKLIVRKKVRSFLAERDARFLNKFKKAFLLIQENPFAPHPNVAPLKNNLGHFRLRIGKYRILYQVNQKEVFVYLYKAGSRGSVYK